MKLLYALTVLVLFSSCNKKEEAKKIPLKTPSKEKITENSIGKFSNTTFKSILRPNQDLELNKVYTDTVQFIEYNTDFDYYFIDVKKVNEIVGLNTNSDDIDFNRGDVLEVKWKIDSIFIAGDGERLDFSEWLVDVKKIKDGNLSLFKKKYKKPIKFYTTQEDMSDGYKDFLYRTVEYYLANSKKELVKLHIQNQLPDEQLSYSIEDRELGGRSYAVLGLANEFEHRTSIIQWLYVDKESKKLYEYDLGNDKLVEFP
ncbi:hypothetical protein [Flavobacterium foetidum]|uniref:hypothetical protein n=1 Tax=Flavobacterium foetidum TaxID=2026681 RepID=UPI0010751FF9|nr:hypothetical protein [Flavobacterium foetidum]KAF2510598.1 hypothetical protein E0W73_17920 [Flavobacterium foetidum]